MASNWRASITLLDSNGIKTTLNFKATFDNLTLADEFSDADGALSDLLSDLAAVSTATIYQSNLTLVGDGDASLPADADVTDVAFVVTYLTGAGVLPKYHTLRIPAPDDTIFGADGVTIDKADAALIAYVANFLDGAFEVSDGEHIVDDIDNGIKGGSWASVKKSPKAVQSAV